jgi:hypothetical protein
MLGTAWPSWIREQVMSRNAWIVLGIALLACAIFLSLYSSRFLLLAPQAGSEGVETSPETLQNSPKPSNPYRKRTDWTEPGGGNAKISAFAFRDLNRNGTYDLEDAPMAAVAFELLGPDNKRVIGRSNINGFCNFKISAALKEGEYAFRALTPPGWELTTQNEVQNTSFQLKPDSRGEMISTIPAAPFGFSQTLTIAGRVDPASRSTVSSTSPSGETSSVILNGDGRFLIPTAKGTWVIEAKEGSETKTKRSVNVGTTPVVLSQMRAGEGEPDIGSSILTLGFDDLIVANSVLELPSGYGGLNWRNWVVTHRESYGGEGYVNNVMSGEYVAYNSSGHPASVFSDKPFDFVGGYFSVAWSDAEGEILLFEGRRGDELVFEDEIELSAISPVYFDANYSSITSLKISALHYWQFVADNISFRVN